jgi:predicted nucleotidyltransferase
MFGLFRRKRDFQKLIAPIIPRLKSAGVKRLGFFGSFARGEDNFWSDVDVLVELGEDYHDYDNLWNVYEALQSIFKGKKIDLLTPQGLSPYIGPKILSTVKYVNL